MNKEDKKYYFQLKEEALQELNKYDPRKVKNVIINLSGQPDSDKANLFALILANEVLKLGRNSDENMVFCKMFKKAKLNYAQG